MSNESHRINWRTRWLESVYEFANLKLQHMSWVEGPSANWSSGEIWCSSYSECFCKYFDDLSLTEESGGYKARVLEGLISSKEANLALNFHTAANGYSRSIDNDLFVIEDPNWKLVVDEAIELWLKLKNCLTSTNDSLVIKSLEQKFGYIPSQGITK